MFAASALNTPEIAPAYTSRLDMAPVPSLRMPDETMDPTPHTASSTTS